MHIPVDAEQPVAYIHHVSATEWANDARGRRATERYRQLVIALGEELRNRYGWKAAVARRLGVHPSYISKIVANEVEHVGGEMIDRAATALGLDQRYFLDSTDTPYAKFLTGGAAQTADAPESGFDAAKRMWRVLRRRADAIRQCEAENATDLQLLKARDIAQAVLASRIVQSALAITATEDAADAWQHALQIAAQAEAEGVLLDTWEAVQQLPRPKGTTSG